MKNYMISVLAHEFGLSRSTLLYYDRIGLLRPGLRSAAGYRLYTEEDRDRLRRICAYRTAGIALQDIGELLARKSRPGIRVLEKRLHELEGQIAQLKRQQHLLVDMLQGMSHTPVSSVIDKETWISILRGCGMDEGAMTAWHIQFERQAPAAHQEFLRSLGITEEEVRKIREWAQG